MRALQHGTKQKWVLISTVLGNNWASVREPHLIMLMCEPHTVCAQVVSVGDSLP